MQLSTWLRPRRQSRNHPAARHASGSPLLERLDARVLFANVHFVGAASSVDSSTGALVVVFKEAGLGTDEAVDMSLTGTANATYQWINRVGRRVGTPYIVNEPFSVSGTFFSDTNGLIEATLTADAPSAEEFLSTRHAANWTPLLQVSYSDVVVTDTTNGVRTADSGIDLAQPSTVFQPAAGAKISDSLFASIEIDEWP
jgi:hypothetical protein